MIQTGVKILSGHRFCLPFLCLCLAALIPVDQAEAQGTELTQKGSFYAAGSQTTSLPFWFQANTNGLLSGDGAMTVLRYGLKLNSAQERSFKWSLGADLIGRASPEQSAFFHQLYASVQYRAFELASGWREHTAGLVDSTLSSGSMLISSNAATIPRVSIETPEFTDVPGTFGLIAFKGHFSHGWLGGDRIIEHPFLHEKSFYLRVFGKEDFPVLGTAGFIHTVIWGGGSGASPPSLADFFDVVTGHEGIGDDPKGTIGNTVATFDTAIQITVKSTRILIYRQFFYEDRVDLRFRSPLDGLYGISVRGLGRPKLVNHVIWEFINTLRQGNRTAGKPRTNFSMYYQHGSYRTGWTHRGRTLGNPLLFSDGSLDRPVKNSILFAHHFGLAGNITDDLSYRAFATYSRNYGTRDDCGGKSCSGTALYYTGRKDQYSFLFEITSPLPIHGNMDIVAAVAWDTGELYQKSFGGRLGLTWSDRRGGLAN